MDEKRSDTGTDEQYEETTDPHNPPNSMLRPQVRTEWLLSSVGTLAIIFVVVAAVFGWVYVSQELGNQVRIYPDPQTEGTSGEQQARENTPGGFNPASGAFRTTQEELRFRGAGGSVPEPELAENVLTDAGELLDAPIGARVSLTDVTVDRTDGNLFWVRDGDVTVGVAVAGNTPTVRAGQHVNVRGTIEESAAGRRIRASRIDVR